MCISGTQWCINVNHVSLNPFTGTHTLLHCRTLFSQVWWHRPKHVVITGAMLYLNYWRRYEWFKWPALLDTYRVLSYVLSDTFILLLSSSTPMRACARVRACAHGCIRTCVREWVRACVRVYDNADDDDDIILGIITLFRWLFVIPPSHRRRCTTEVLVRHTPQWHRNCRRGSAVTPPWSQWFRHLSP